MMSISTYLEETLGMVLHPTPRGFKALCPFHDENTPSFYITVHEDGSEVAHCFGSCPLGQNHIWDIVGLLRWLPREKGGYGWLPLEEQKRAFRLANQKAVAFGLVSKSESAHLKTTPTETTKARAIVVPRARHRLAMTRVFKMTRDFLRGPEGGIGLDYLTEYRHVKGPYLSRIQDSIGYMPKEKKYHELVLRELRSLFNGNADEIAREIGLLSASGRFQIVNRLVFAVFAHQHVVWYQARSCNIDGPKATRFYNPPVFTKQCYIPLPPEQSLLAGTRLTEGPIDAVSFAAQGIFSCATMGANNLLTAAQLKALPHPIHLYLDNQEQDQAGATALAQYIRLCTVENIPFVIPHYPDGLKDANEWLGAVGPSAFYSAQMQETLQWQRQRNQEQVNPQPASLLQPMLSR